MSFLWEKIIRPALFALDAERAHEIGLGLLAKGIAPTVKPIVDERLNQKLFGLQFPNPLGLAAGFDKNAVALEGLSSLGFGFVEVGTVTLAAQAGNPKPRMFRLGADSALINRLGFNNLGAAAVADNLRRTNVDCIVGVNIGRNKDVPNEQAIENYVAAFDTIRDAADYVAVNISSPNTPNLRELQSEQTFDALLAALLERNRAGRQKPLLVKIAPDIDDADIERIVDACLRLGINGVIATNTTIDRTGLRSQDVAAIGSGGLSGRPLARRSTEVISKLYRHSQGRLPIIGVGGIFTAEDALEKIAAGASLIQAYTGFIYRGPTFVRDVNAGLLRLIDESGAGHISELIGSASPV